ncbi:MAG TPA: CsgG/HfaB family protein [Acidobacteriota bacterium]
MRTNRSSILLWMAVLLLAPGLAAPVAAQAKIRIAIWDFENNSERSWWFYNDLGPAARNHIDTAFAENPTLSAKFSVIEREKLDMVLKEQGLGSAGALNPQTAAQVGQILGIKYILTGAIDKFAINTTKGGFRGIGGSHTKAEATINMRFIETTTAERAVSLAADGSVTKGGGFFKGASLSREDEWGIASEAVEKAALAVVAKFVSGSYADQLSAAGGPGGGGEGKIIKVEGNRAWINIGANYGIKVGDQFAIFSVGEALIDPDTGMNLGAEEKQSGSGQVVEVQDKFSILTFTGSAQARDVVRK